MRLSSPAAVVLLLFISTTSVFATEIQLASEPELSPDGRTLLYVYGGDIWRVSARGGEATRLTLHRAVDGQPHYSPDGTRIAFISHRTGSPQVFVMPAEGGLPQQRTFHTEGYSLLDWYPDGERFLTLADRDHFWKYSDRFISVSSAERSGEDVLFNGIGKEGSLSPDGSKLLFVREGERWWRKGYQGSRAAQIWLFNLKSEKFTKLLSLETGCRSPVWKPDGSGFYYCGSQNSDNGARNLFDFSFDGKISRQLTHFDDDLVVTPCVSRDGRTLVFSRLFDLYRMQIRGKKVSQPERIVISIKSDTRNLPKTRRSLDAATAVTFSKDGLEVAFIAGGDVWVMDTQLREPKQITHTPEFESAPVFSKDGNSIFFIGWNDGQPDIWKAERADNDQYWWQNDQFTLSALTNDATTESRLKLSPNGKELAFVRERGDLWMLDITSGKARELLSGFQTPSFDFSPDGKWIVYSQLNNEFNGDIWIRPVDGSSDPVNISRHPDDESNPVWSPDGKLIAFTGRRSDDEVDIYYVWLQKENHEIGSRDRKLKKTLEALKKSRGQAAETPEIETTDDEPSKKGSTVGKPISESKSPVTKIDFDGIHRRLRRISIPNTTEYRLLWSHDGSKLAFAATINGKRGTWYVSIPDSLTPKFITTATGSGGRWTKSPERILWLTSDVPASQSISGTLTKYSFKAYQSVSQSARNQAAFDASWRVMKDWWYDSNYGNHNWDEIRRKYRDAAANVPDSTTLSTVIHLMLGELNGSHLGFRGRSVTPRDTDDWRPVTAHLGVRFDDLFKGPGLRISDVIGRGPADQVGSRLAAGEVILSIDGTPVDPAQDLTSILNGRLARDIHLRVRGAGADPKERDVVLRPVSYATIRSLLYQHWMDGNRTSVDGLAKSQLGYLHIRGMNWSSFLEFERELYDVAYGKDGLIIDVRDNGGGSTTDHLLTVLTQPQHSITVPRGGGQGYPHSRKVYATWNKPIVVLCNQNSYSNAEIFAHAIKGLQRGKIVGVPTAGGVISTGTAGIMDMGTLRRPYRGWFIRWTGEDMELNGCLPHLIVWPQPAEIPNGKDRQLEAAVKVLAKQVKKSKRVKSPILKKATDRS